MICPFCGKDRMWENDNGKWHDPNCNYCWYCEKTYTKQQVINRILNSPEENEIKGNEATHLVSKKEIIIFAIALFIVVLLCFVANIQNRCL